MNRKHPLYPAFRADLDRLDDSVGGNRWVKALRDHARRNASDWPGLLRIVDRVDDSLGDLPAWRNIRTAYGLRGTKYR